MNRRSLIFALSVCAALLLAGLWQLNAPREQKRVLKPAEADIFADGQSPTGNPLEPGLDEPQLADYTPAPKKLAPPPEAPVVVNDVRDRICLRLIDSRTNRPVADTNCELLKLSRLDSSFVPARTGTRRLTDADGLMSFSAGVLEDIELEDRARGWEVAFYWDDLMQFIVPVPLGWQPVSGIHDVAAALDALTLNTSSKPIDVLVAPEATLRIVPRDEWGQVIQDAKLEYCWLGSGLSAEDWLEERDDILHFPGSQWSRLCDNAASDFRHANVIAEFGGKQLQSAHTFTDLGLHHAGMEPRPGSVVLRGLPCVRIGAFGRRAGIGVGYATIDLQPGANELNVYLPTPVSCTLNVRIEWLGDPLDEVEAPQLSIYSTGPYGNVGLIGRDESVSFDWALDPNGGTAWQGRITNMVPGCWQLEARFWSEGGYASVRIEAGETRSVTLYCGDGAQAHWTPVVRLNGSQLERCSLRILGGSFTEPEVVTVNHDTSTRETSMLELQAGTYTIWIPTLKPKQITLAPGETRTDAFELLCANVHFTIDAPLTELLSLEGASVQLNLFPSDGWAEAEEHLIEIDAGLRKQDEEFDQLRPGVVRVWTVPLGKYSWQLVGANQKIEGELSLASLSETVHFGLRSLPGYELCEVEFVGFEDDDLPDISFEPDGTTGAAISAFAGDGEMHGFSADLSRKLGDSSGIAALVSAEGAIIYAFGRRGGAQVTVDSETARGQFRAEFPGRIVVTPSRLGEPVDGSLMLLSEVNNHDDCKVDWFHEDGSYGRYEANDTIRTAKGWLTLVASRRLTGEAAKSYETARVQVRITGDEQMLDLDSLDYERMAKVNLVFKGRGSPDSPFDAWWYGDDGPTPVLLALDQTIGSAPRLVTLWKPDRVLPDGRLEFTYDNRMLPPGRYKVIPWHGAAEKYCKTFTLAPGSQSTVTIDGG